MTFRELLHKREKKPALTHPECLERAPGSTENAIAGRARGSLHKPAAECWLLLWVENTIPVGFPASTPALGCSARTAPCWLLPPGRAWRRAGAGGSSTDVKLWLVAVVAGRQRHSAQSCCFSQGHLSRSRGRGSFPINGCGFVAGLACWGFFKIFFLVL